MSLKVTHTLALPRKRGRGLLDKFWHTLLGKQISRDAKC